MYKTENKMSEIFYPVDLKGRVRVMRADPGSKFREVQGLHWGPVRPYGGTPCTQCRSCAQPCR